MEEFWAAMIVVDTNILAYFVIPSDYTAVASDLLQKDAEWAAPQLWRSEFANVLAGYMRRNTIDLERAIQFHRTAEVIIGEREATISYEKILSLVASSNCTSYDCEFVALAIELACPLVTMDKKILAEFPKIAVSLLDF